MPEAAAVTPAPTQHANAPQNAAPAQPAAPVVDPVATLTEKLKAAEADREAKKRELIVERRKYEGERKGVTEKLTKLEQLEKREAAARMNPPEFLKSIYGENWHDVVTTAKVNGVPPAELIQQELQRFKDELASGEKSKQEQAAKADAEAREQQTEHARQTIFASSASWYRESAKEFPLLAKIGAEPAVARTMAARIEHEFHKSGKILTNPEVASLIEDEVLEWAREATKHEKYKAKLQPAAASTTVAVPSKQQVVEKPHEKQPTAARSRITNNLTGSTQTVKAPVSDADRQARVQAAWDAEKAKRKG